MLALHTALPGSPSWIYGEKAKGEKVGRGSKMMVERVKKRGGKGGRREATHKRERKGEMWKDGRGRGGVKGGDVPSSGHSASGRKGTAFLRL